MDQIDSEAIAQMIKDDIVAITTMLNEGRTKNGMLSFRDQDRGVVIAGLVQAAAINRQTQAILNQGQ